MILLRTNGVCTMLGIFEGTGGWAYLIDHPKAHFELAGGGIETTKECMEMEAIIQGLTQVFETKRLYDDENNIVVFTRNESIVKVLNGSITTRDNLDIWAKLNIQLAKLCAKGFTIDIFFETGKIKADERQVERLAKEAKDNMKKIVSSFNKTVDEWVRTAEALSQTNSLGHL